MRVACGGDSQDFGTTEITGKRVGRTVGCHKKGQLPIDSAQNLEEGFYAGATRGYLNHFRDEEIKSTKEKGDGQENSWNFQTLFAQPGGQAPGWPRTGRD
jgi:hypothetical protein